MSKKPHKVEEPAAPYAATKPAKMAASESNTEVQYIDPATARVLIAKIVKKRKNLLARLAQ